MRIGILTYHWVYNFGANLQTLATSRFLGRMGHDVWILNYRPQDLEDLYRQRIDAAQADTHENFYAVHLRQSPVCRSEKELVAFCRETGLDAVVAGSDAVFRLSKELDRSDTRFPNPFWLVWATSSLQPAPMTAALAATAMGTNYFAYSSSVRRGISDAIRRMSLVSVRDRWTQLMLFTVTGGRCWAPLCPDPVIVLNDVFQLADEHAREPVANHRRYILMSIYSGMLSNEWIQRFVKIAHSQGLQVFSLPLPEGEVKIPVDRVLSLPLSPLTWYAWIQHAAGFIGVRFHPVVCSMANDVPFVSFDTYQRKLLRIASKTYDLCTRTRTRSLCLNDQSRRDLSPRKAFEKLLSREQDNAKSYAMQAKRDFSRIAADSLDVRRVTLRNRFAG